MLKTTIVTLGLLVLCTLAGGIIGLGAAYVVTRAGQFGQHDGAILAAILVLGGVCLGFIAGGVAAYRRARTS